MAGGIKHKGGAVLEKKRKKKDIEAPAPPCFTIGNTNRQRPKKKENRKQSRTKLRDEPRQINPKVIRFGTVRTTKEEMAQGKAQKKKKRHRLPYHTLDKEKRDYEGGEGKETPGLQKKSLCTGVPSSRKAVRGGGSEKGKKQTHSKCNMKTIRRGKDHAELIYRVPKRK